jgi:hypothetical protein
MSLDGKSAIVDLLISLSDDFELFFTLGLLRLYLTKPINTSAIIVMIVIIIITIMTINDIPIPSVSEITFVSVFCEPFMLIEKVIV